MTFLLPAMLLLALPFAALSVLRPAPALTTRILRAAVFALLILALARPALKLPRRAGLLVIVADRSASIPPEERAAQNTLIEAASSRRPSDAELAVVSFAARAIVEHPPQTAPFKGFSAVHDPDASDLAAALTAAAALAPKGAPARILALTDGRFTSARPQAAGIPIDYRLQTRRAANDLAIARVEAPQTLRPGEAMLATAWVDSPFPDAREIIFTLRRGNAEIFRSRRKIPAGISPLVFRDLTPSAAGSAVAGYELRLEMPDAPPDPAPENNAARFLVQVSERKPLLHISANPAAAGLSAALAASGVKVLTLPPEKADFSLASLAGFSGIAIENIRADALGSAALENIAAWVEDGGAGLLMTGGANSFGMGGYYKSPLERVLPVSLEMRRENRKHTMAVAVVLDRSGSMAAPISGGRVKMDMANLGSMEILGLLSDNDEISVIAVDSAPHVILPLMNAAAARAESGHIMAIQSMGGGIFVYEGLVAGLKQLANSKAAIRHLLLFADAADAEEPGDYKKLIAAATATGISISVVGLGTPADSDAALLRDIAAIGGGECFFSDNAMEIPRIFAQDTFAVARAALVTDPAAPAFTRALPLLSDSLPPSAPQLGGYNLCYLRPEATAIAISSDDNAAPLVATRPAGIGRAAVFTGEADGELSGAFANWEHASEFYAALARFTAGPQEASAAGFVFRQRLVSGGVEITAYADSPTAAPLTATLLRHNPGATPRTEKTRLEWTAPDALSAIIPLSGAETLLASIALPSGEVLTLPPTRLPYSPEFAPERGAENGAETMATLAETTGGRQIADPGAIWDTMPKERRAYEISPFLYLLAALIFLAEILERRTGFFSQRRLKTKSARKEKSKNTPAKKAKKTKSAPPPKEPPEPPTAPPPPAPKAPPTTEDAFAKAKRRASR